MALIPHGYNNFNKKILERSAVKYNNGYITRQVTGEAEPTKIVHADLDLVVRVTAFLTIFVRGTLFNLNKQIYVQLLGLYSVFIAMFFLLTIASDPLEFEHHSLEQFLILREQTQAHIPFLFGLFASTVLKRWWTVRADGIGAIGKHLIVAVTFITQQAAVLLTGEEDWNFFVHEGHSKLVRWGISSQAFIAFECRGGLTLENADGLVRINLLTVEERDLLLNGHERPTVVLWSWMTALSGELMDMLKIPAPIHNSPYQDLRMGLAGVHSIHEHIRTQLPFPYVHMTTMVVNMNNLVMCCVAGFQCAIHYHEGAWLPCLLLAGEMLVVPLLYIGVLQVCAYLSDPMGDDIIDFPILEYMISNAEGCAAPLSLRELYQSRRRKRQSPLPSVRALELKDIELGNLKKDMGTEQSGTVTVPISNLCFPHLNEAPPRLPAPAIKIPLGDYNQDSLMTNMSGDLQSESITVPAESGKAKLFAYLDQSLDDLATIVASLQSSMSDLEVQLATEMEPAALQQLVTAEMNNCSEPS